MQQFFNNLKKTSIASVAFLLVAVFPLSGVSFADDPPPCVAPADSRPGVHSPTGSDAGAFTYQCDGAYAGMWTSAHYVYNPNTNSESPLDPVVYTYNPSTDSWDTVVWNYSPVRNAYYSTTFSTGTPPAGATTVGGPAPKVASAQDPSSDPSSDDPSAKASSNALGAGSNNGVDNSGNFNTLLTNTTTAGLNNGISSHAGSGNASVTGNTTGGSATSGNAQAIANIINMLQSSSNVLGDPNMVTFTANINGDVNGDLLLDPAKLGTIQPANTSNTLDNNVTVNNSVDASINNKINLDATSGDAGVVGNTNAGDATTGNARAVANIVNVLNSAVTAGKSFFGVININGNLNGDILLPPDFIDTLLASNVPRFTVNTATLNNNVTINNNNNSSINNNLDASARSGNANVADNTTGGNATSGLANTDLTVFNLTGSQLIASNDLLVFVNVQGQWFGMLMNAPAGTTAASLGGGVTSNTTVNNDATLNNTNDQSINNDVTLRARTGNADVVHNTHAGNATSGDATSSINLMNMINDRLSLNGWFGLLFINVYGTWNGSFGINTSAGDPLVASSQSDGSAGTPPPVFQFVAATPGGSNLDYSATAVSGSTSGTSGDGLVLAAKTSKGTFKAPTSDGISAVQKATNHFILPIIGASFALLILFAGERRRAH